MYGDGMEKEETPESLAAKTFYFTLVSAFGFAIAMGLLVI